MSFTRRSFIEMMLISGCAALLPPSWVLAGESRRSKKRLVVIFLRGGMDGLATVIPFGDSYFSKSSRPNIFIPKESALKIDEYFYFHPQMKALRKLWERGLLTVIHQMGDPTSTSRSHFASQDYIEAGSVSSLARVSGFLGRATSQFENPLKPTCYAAQATLPKSLFGATNPLAINIISEFILPPSWKSNSKVKAHVESIIADYMRDYGGSPSGLMDLLKPAQKEKITTPFPGGELSSHLQDIARIIKAGIDIPVMVTESNGWDTHVGQGAEDGILSGCINDLSESLDCFVTEIGEKIEDVTVVTVTEFGRTVFENGNKGTEHGKGTCMFVLNGNLKRKNIIADWKDLKPENLFEEREIPITTDYRAVFSEILSGQLGIKDLEKVFPGYAGVQKVGLYRA